MDEDAALQGRKNEMLNILEQQKNVDTAREVGAIGMGEYAHRKGLQIAATRALARLDEGESISDEEFAQMVSLAEAEAEMPTEIEALRADVDFLIMTGGGE